MPCHYCGLEVTRPCMSNAEADACYGNPVRISPPPPPVIGWGAWPCVHGHLACSFALGGPCLDETLSNKESRHASLP